MNIHYADFRAKNSNFHLWDSVCNNMITDITAMRVKKKATKQTHKKKKDFVPHKKGARIVWVKNLHKKIQSYASKLNLTGTK
ncbi:MAG: hypothetical protein HY063_10270 [Bacteroidetes bacterium]|nr:hypothetical protein [Bacteroidota bacterium]